MINFYKAITTFLFDNKEPVLHVCSDSMYPAFSCGQKVKVIPLRQPLECGKCYIFIHKGKLNIHRLLSVKNDCSVFIGDRSRRKEHVPISAIIAEPEYDQNIVTTFILRYINLFFCRIIPAFPQCALVRVKVIRNITKLEKFFYERKI